MAAAATAWACVVAVLALSRPAVGVLGPPGPPWGLAGDAAPCEGTWSCLRADLAAGLADILATDQYNVTAGLAVERVRYADDVDGGLERMAADLNEAGLPTLASTAIKVFETHALIWKLWPGMLHLKIFRDPDEGMDAALEVPPSEGSRTWGLGAIAARRRLTMALLPIMYKMGVGTTLLGVLVFIALKTMFMISILFVLAISSFAKHKLSALAHPYPHYHYAPPPPPPHKEVHVHVHADPHKQAYGGWHRYGGHGGVDFQHHPPAQPSYHSAPPAEEGYFESEPTAYSYYHHPHRRVGPGGLVVGVLGQHGQQLQQLQQLQQWQQQWQPSAAAAAAAAREPAFYEGTYS